ncbi:MAG TPA: hypothetical protein VI146_08025 [Nitrososphaeraceae archaeon]
MRGLDTSVFHQSKDILSIFLDTPFWIWENYLHGSKFLKTNGRCCFNHLISLPLKVGIQYPIFDFQTIIFDTLEQNQNIWIKKTNGIGLTTFMLRYLAWKILSSTELDYKSIFIVAGSGDKSIEMLEKKLKNLFEKRFPLLRLESKFTGLWLKKTWIKVVTPKNMMNIDFYDTAYLFIAELDNFGNKEQEALERLTILKEGNCKFKTIMASTSKLTGNLFDKIENDPTCGYTKLKLDYNHGPQTS